MEKLRLGVIGVGSVVREIYQWLYYHSRYSEKLEIVGIADPNAEYRNWFGDLYGIPRNRRFKDYRPLLETVEMDAAQVNTPDHLHAPASIAALEAGLDVLVPKPTAATIRDAHRMIATAKRTGRLLGIDYHKRQDPRIKEVQARYQNGRYGTLQATVWYMIDKLMVADPNHQPAFFATPDFAARNTSISFLTVHMCDALLRVVDLKPIAVRATGWKQKLPTLEPIAVDGFDLCDTEIRLDNGAVAHIITGWALPNTAHANTVQSGRLICTDGLVDLGLDTPGIYEIHADGIAQVNPLFKNFEKDGTVTGYGIDSPGRLLMSFLAARNGRLDDDVRAALMDPAELGLWTTAVCQAGEASLDQAEEVANGAWVGPEIDIRALLAAELGADVAAGYMAS